MRALTKAGVTAVLALSGACEGQIGERSGPRGAALDPTLPIEIGPDLAPLSAARRCVARLPAERVLGVSPEGVLWLATDPTPGVLNTQIRTFDPVDLTPRAFDVPLSGFGAAVVHSAARASVIAEDGLWVVGETTLLEIDAPFSPSPEAQLCGRLDFDAFVLDGTQLFQREDDEWVRWNGLDEALGRGGTRMLRRDGACWASEDNVVLRGEDGPLWLLTPSTLRAFEPREGQVELLEDQPATVNGNRLLVGGRTFELQLEESPGAFATGGGHGWLRVGPSVLRFDGERFLELQPGMDDSATLHPFAAGGIWLVEESEACVFDPGWVRLSGLAPQERRLESNYTLTVWRDDPAQPFLLTIDRELVTPTRTEGNAVVFEGQLPLGWSDFAVSLDHGGRAEPALRRFQVKRLPGTARSWATDIRPLYEAHCAAAACHIADNSAGAPDLSRYEAWVDRAMALENRVLGTGDMPPLSSRDQTWSEEQAEIVRQWLSGGLKP